MRRVLMSCGLSLAMINTVLYFAEGPVLKYHGHVQLVVAGLGLLCFVVGLCLKKA